MTSNLGYYPVPSLSRMAGEVALRWNTIYPSLYRTYRRLKELGYRYENGSIVVPKVINKKPRKEVYYD